VVTLHQDDDDALDATAAALRAGGVVVIPTDTVYGLAALPSHEVAVRAIYLAKGRPEGMHLPVLVASLAQARRLGVELTGAAEALADRWWPGPLTMVFGFSPRSGRPPWLAGRDEVAVRVPRHPFLLALLESVGALVVTSANPHGATTPATAGEVADLLGGQRVELVIDGGALDGDPSTLVNVRQGHYGIEREGALPAPAIEATLAAATRTP
jgi:L-threonylcarbamoyladenylate synthase